jgi:hypothetical protein
LFIFFQYMQNSTLKRVPTTKLIFCDKYGKIEITII